MIRWVAGLARRAGATLLLLLMLLCGAEVALRIGDLRTSRSRLASRPNSPVESLVVPSWLTYWELRPAATVRIPAAESSASHVVRINSFGIRGAEPLIPKPQDRYRVVCLGDERLLAAHQPDEEHLVTRLEHDLQAATKLTVEVWNAGVPGACPLTQSLQLTHRLSALQPDLVLCFVHPESLVRDQAYRRLTRIDRQGFPLACRHPTLGMSRKPSSLTAWRQEFRLIDKALQCAGDAWKEQTSFDPASISSSPAAELPRLLHDPLSVERTLQPLASLADWCRNSYAALAIVDFSASASPSDAEPPWGQAVRQFAEERRLCHVRLIAANQPDRAEASNSWVAEDHQNFAEAIARRVLADIHGPWNSPYFQSEQTIVTPTGHATEFVPRNGAGSVSDGLPLRR